METIHSAFSFSSHFVSLRANKVRATSWKRPSLRTSCVARRRARIFAQAATPAVDVEIPLPTEVVVSPLRAGIKSIAIGKEGTRPIPSDLIDPIIAELKRIEEIDISEIGDDDLRLDYILLRASFMGSLFVKESLDESEMKILCMACNEEHIGGLRREAHEMTCSSREVLYYITNGYMPMDPQATILRCLAFDLLNGEPLTQEKAEFLGDILYNVDGLATKTAEDLFAWTRQHREGKETLEDVQALINESYPTLGKHPADLAEKALIAHVMRIRHETAEEIAGLARAARNTLAPQFRTERFEGGSLFVHIAEPFDGAVTWDIITPLVARHLREKYGLRTVMVGGATAGPKYGPNLIDVVQELGVWLVKDTTGVLAGCEEEFGAAVQQSDASPGLAAWAHTRRVILKRPSIATVEKYVDAAPGGADIFVASAFHGAYVDKMAAAAEAVEYRAYVIIGSGMEGSTGLGVGPRRKGLFLLGLRAEDGTYDRETIEFGAADAGVEPSGDKPPKGEASASATATKIRKYVDSDGDSGDALFDARVRTTLGGFDAVFVKIEKHLGIE